MQTYNVIGLMSGSSLDGVDIAFCQLITNEGNWSFKILHCDCVPFNNYWKEILQKISKETAFNYHRTHVYLGHYLGQLAKKFIQKYQIEPDLICSHGHTVFHEPSQRFTSQIGDGAAIAATTGIQTVSDLRTSDLALGGQGAPIVPIGDWHLFKDFRFCLNIGGIANISAKINNSILAFDIGAANQILNSLANVKNKAFDRNGEMAKAGLLNDDLLNELNALPFFQKSPPKSLSNQWVKNTIPPILQKYQIPIEDKLNTFSEHLAVQIGQTLKAFAPTEKDRMLITGGGTFNKYLVERIAFNTPVKISIPESNIIKYKEALVMAFIGVLRVRNEANVLKSVTGANKNSISGAIYAA